MFGDWTLWPQPAIPTFPAWPQPTVNTNVFTWAGMASEAQVAALEERVADLERENRRLRRLALRHVRRMR